MLLSTQRVGGMHVEICWHLQPLPPTPAPSNSSGGSSGGGSSGGGSSGGSGGSSGGSSSNADMEGAVVADGDAMELDPNHLSVEEEAEPAVDDIVAAQLSHCNIQHKACMSVYVPASILASCMERAGIPLQAPSERFMRGNRRACGHKRAGAAAEHKQPV